MNSLMQRALGADWNKLPAALQAHHRFGTTRDSGHLDIEYPRFMQPCLRGCENILPSPPASVARPV